MTKHEAAREIIRQNGGCATVECDDCPLHEGIFECNAMLDAKRAEEWLAANTEVTKQEGVPYCYPEYKESPMPKYKIDPIPGLPSWFTPGIVCRVKTKDMGIWCSPRPVDRFWGDYKEAPFEDRDGKFWSFAEPVEAWEPQEGEWVAAWYDTKPTTAAFIVKYDKEFSNERHYARLQYPDGRVIDCACSIEELKGRTDWQ